MSEMLESDEDDVPLRGRVRRLNPPRKPPRGEDSSSEEGVTPSAPESSDDGASPPSWGAKRASSDDSDDSEGGVVKRGRRGKAWGPTQPQGGGEDEEEEASDDDASSSKESSGEDEGEDELQHAPCITFREPLRELSAGEAPEDDVSPVPERTERGKRAHSPDSESEDGAPKRGRMGSSLKAAFDWYVTQGYVVHSLEIKTKLTTVGEKKVPAWGGVLWGAARSTFVPSCNSLSIDCGRSSLIVIDVDLPAMDAWAGVEAETGGRCDTFTVRTGNGGLHLYFKAFDDEQLNRTFAKQFKLNGVALDIDVRAKGGCIFAAPSSYKNLSGERRSYVVIKDAAVAEMPQALIAKLKSMLPESSDGGVGRARGRRAGAAADPAPNATGARQNAGTRPEGAQEAAGEGVGRTLDESAALLKEVAAATDALSSLAMGPAEAWDSHDTTVRIAFALNNISRGTNLLLDQFIQLARTSPKAQPNVVAWATALYYTPPADGGPRPGLSFLRGLLGSEADERARKRAELKEKLALADCPTDDRLLDGLEHGHVLPLGRFLAAHSLRDYRVALDVVQHDRPGFQHGHVLYKRQGGRWVQEAACKLNYEDYLSSFLFSVLDKVLAVPDIKESSPAFWKGTEDLRTNMLRFKPGGKEPIKVACEQLRIDAFYRENDVPDPETFFKLLNSQHHLIGFDNGVLDMSKFEFYTPGRVPEDAYVSYSCGYAFPGDRDGEPTTPALRAQMEEVEALLAIFFPRGDVRSLFKSVMAIAAGVATLKQVQVFCIFFGHLGSNGKSALLNWLDMVFGPCYSKSLDPGYLTHTADPNKPQSGLMEMRGVRVARINEANPSESGATRGMAILNEFLKRWTGGDPIQMRGMYGNSAQVVLDAIPILVVNNYPRFSKPEEDALLRRLALVPFESRFVDLDALANPDAHIFVKDPSIEQTFQRLVPAFALCLVKWGRELRANSLQLQRPFTTYPQILDYIEEVSQMEPDGVVAAQKEVARTWLLNTFTASVPAADCPDTSATCPKAFVKGKPVGRDPCPCVWTGDRLYEAFKEANPPAAEGTSSLAAEKFYGTLRKAFPPHKNVKNRHLNAWGSTEAFFVKKAQ